MNHWFSIIFHANKLISTYIVEVTDQLNHWLHMADYIDSSYSNGSSTTKDLKIIHNDDKNQRYHVIKRINKSNKWYITSTGYYCIMSFDKLLIHQLIFCGDIILESVNSKFMISMRWRNDVNIFALMPFHGKIKVTSKVTKPEQGEHRIWTSL